MQKITVILLLSLVFFSCKVKKSEDAGSEQQNTFIIKGFSNEYYGKLYIEDSEETFSPGWIAIYRESNNEEIFRVEAEQLYFELHDGEVKANIQELPYGEQSVIIYDDFNFDGIKDFAIMDGMGSCYGGPSFSIYLGDNKGNFNFNEDFTRLAHDYCGMFDYNMDEKVINTMTKSGCCWHQFSQFVVENNIPVEIYTAVVDAFNFPYEITTVTERKNGKMIETTTREIDVSSIDAILTFALENGKKVFVFPMTSNNIINYVLLKENETSEFDYYYDVKESNRENFKFETTSQGKTLTFSNRNVVYEIYEFDDMIGVKVNIDGQVYDLKGKLSTKQGSLSKINTENYENVF